MANFLKSKKGKNFLNFVYGIGASVVIFGAWMKILHLPGANLFLTIGLLTEVIIFAISAFDFPDAGYDWTLVYPELAAGSSLDSKRKGLKSASQQLDQMLQKAKMGPELIDSLQKGFTNLNDNVSRMADLSDASVATKEYSSNVKAAAQSVGQLGEAASSAVESVTGMTVNNELTQQYHVQVQNLVKNLSSLNANYELEQQNTNDHLQAMNKFYGSMHESLEALSASTESAKQYRDEIAILSKNLNSLNAIYGNMLTAMNPQARV